MGTERSSPSPRAAVDAAGLRAFRAGLGLLLACAILRYFLHGWIDSQFLAPTVFFPLFGWDWLRPAPDLAMHALFALLLVAALLLAAGIRHRLAAAVLAAGFAYTQILDKTNYLNHYYLFVLLLVLLACLPVGRRGPVRIPPGCYTMLRFQVGCVYFFAGLHKLQADWLLDAQPLRLWFLHAQDRYGGPGWLDAPAIAYAAAWASACFDLTVPFLLSWRRTRALAYAGTVLFHLLTAVLFPIGLFPWVMICVATVFFDPAWPRRLRTMLGRGLAGRPPPPTPPGRPAGPAWRTAAVLWGAVQILVPLRTFAYPGDDLWTEEAFRFSWKVMLIEKYATAEFELRDPVTGERFVRLPGEDLTPIQERMMAHQPDMVLQYAHHLRDSHRRQHGRTPQVRVRCRVMLNGRPSRPLIDPQTDLAREAPGWRPKSWLLPSPREP